MRQASPILAAISFGLLACSGQDTGVSMPGNGGSSSNASTGGEAATTGGSSATSNTGNGGETTASGGAATGGKAAGGTSTGAAATGGKAAGGASTGGAATGGKAAGSTSTGGAATGGKAAGGTSTGGAASGGKAAGGTSTGGAATGGAATGGSTSTSPCSVSPVNPNATQQAKNLLCYLYSIYGKSVLSGQQETSWGSNPATDVNWINTQTGKYPAVLGGDYLYPNGTTTRALDWWKNGGIPMIRYHMGAPPNSDTFDNSKGSADINAVLTSGTSANTSFNSKLDYVAKELLILQTGNAAVIWAPFHETQAGGWFWWAKGTGAQFISLWKYMYDYLTNTKKVNNVVWLMPFSGSPSADYYPGKDFVDISGPDTYATTGMPFASNYTATTKIVGTTIPIALHETGTVPQPSTMFPSTAPWVLFNIWNGYENDSSKNSVDSIKSAYADSHTITRDEVPNLK